MADAYVGEIRSFGFTFAPTGWAECNGQLLAISNNTALFSLLGTTYGGNGSTTFALPDLRGRLSMHPGNGPGLSARFLGESGGAEQVTLNSTQLPSHAHPVRAVPDPGELQAPSSQRGLARSVGGAAWTAPANLVPMAPGAVTTVGGTQPHNNNQPYLVVRFCIALQGVYPSRS